MLQKAITELFKSKTLTTIFLKKKSKHKTIACFLKYTTDFFKEIWLESKKMIVRINRYAENLSWLTKKI